MVGCFMMKKSFLRFLAPTLVLTGCASFSGVESSSNVARLKFGQTQSEVLSLLGTPDSVVQQSGEVDQWVYEFKRQEKAGQNLYVEFKDGHLVKSGKLTGREIAAAQENRISGVCTKRVHPEVQQESLCIK